MITRARKLILLTGILLLTTTDSGANFYDDEFVPAARRALFHGVRTHWHDLLGRHCPRFGEDLLVAIPIPLPKGWVAADNYKIQFTYDGDRLVTPWLKIIGKGAPTPPLLHIHFTRSSDSLRSVSAKVLPVPQGYLYAHHQLLQEFQNATIWPKHLLVEYSWTTQLTVDALSALYVMFFLCLFVFMAMALSVVVAYETKLKAFMAEIAGEDPLSTTPLGKGD